MSNIWNPYLAGILIATLLVLRHVLVKSRHPPPPGPYRWPLFGNTFQMPRNRILEKFSEWADLYGDMTYLETMGQAMLIVTSAKVAQDLLDKRSGIYSSRPHLTMLNTISGMGMYTVMMPYGDEWRAHRKVMSFGLGRSLLPGYYPMQEKAARALVSDLCESSESLLAKLNLCIGSIIMDVVYGYTVTSPFDPLLVQGLRNFKNGSTAAEPGRWLVDAIPILRYLPQWFPGTDFLRIGAEFARGVHDGTWNAYRLCRHNLELGTANLPNLCQSVLTDIGRPPTPQEESTLAWAAATLFVGGMETTISILQIFIYHMILHPNIQKKAQQELDRLLNDERLPSIQDAPSLPYVRSVITEVIRLYPPFPFSIPHALTQDDVYNNFLLPEGTVVWPSIWHILRNPAVHPNPLAFNPDRYSASDSEMNKVHDLVFGFGRRKCVGQDFATGTLFAIVSTILATCDVLPALDRNEKEVLPVLEFPLAFQLAPKEFSSRIVPRSQKASELLNSAKD